MEPVFHYDFNSPYAYLAASRVDATLGVAPRWQPIAFAFVLRAHGRVPWSLGPERGAGVSECERRARAYGLPPLAWPPGWPRESYTLEPLRAALVAAEHGLLREYSMAAFRRNFAAGTGLLGDAHLEVAEEVGLDPEVVSEGVAGAARAQLTEVTEAAVAAGVPGVPTVTVAGEHFWGDDRLEEAARAVAPGGASVG
jgi:2-hydroxychromene-2-carboxylate isomerase